MNLKKILPWCVLALAATAHGRTINLQLAKSDLLAKSKDSIIQEWSHEVKFKIGVLKVGRPGPKDPTNDVKVVAATVVKHAKTKKTYLNDIQLLPIDADVAAGAFEVYIATGACEKRQDILDKKFTTGWMPEGIIVELWADGKMSKRLATFAGPLSKAPLVERDQSKLQPIYLPSDCMYDEPIPKDDEPEDFCNETMFVLNGKKYAKKRK